MTLLHGNHVALEPGFGGVLDLTPTDVKVGEKYAVLLPDHNAAVVLEFKKELSNGLLKFVKLGTDLEFHFSKGEWGSMRSDRRSCRISEGRRGRSAGEIEDIDPLSMLDPDDPGITAKERATRLKAQKRLREARTLRFYALRYDEQPAGWGHKGVGDFIADNYQDARAAGFTWMPSSGALIRALQDCGVPGERPLCAFLSRRGRHDRGKRWPELTLELAVAMATAYWSERGIRQTDVISEFYDAFDKENDARRNHGEAAFVRPSKETLRLWINAGANYWNWRQKYGKASALRRFKGHGRAIEASCPLEYVMLDHTRIDAWAVIFDENGTKVLVERPWLTLAVDVYSKMILGAVLTYEPPSVYSALRCLRQVVRKKDFLIQEFGDHKGATDGWGKPINVIVDNGWEWVGTSFQVCCEAAGIHVIWAPVKNPQFKPYVERAFGVLNANLWHRLESGIPFKPHEMTALGLDPRTKAVHTLEWLYSRMWHYIVTIYHVEEHGEKKHVPAKRWRDGLVAGDGRPTVDDVGELDKVLGRSEVCLLTTSGITFDTHRFHDREITSDLLDRLLRHAKKRKQRKGQSSGTVAVLCTWDPSDCSFIHVWDWVLKRNIRLPNWDRAYSKGLSWRTAQKIKNFAHEQNMLFHSDAEKHAARATYSRSLKENLPYVPFGQARKSAGELAKPQLIAGDYVQQVAVSGPSTTAEAVDVPQVLPARNREGDRIPDKARRRGGAAATRASQKTRARNSARTERAAARQLPTDPSTRSVPAKQVPIEHASLSDTEAQERLAALAKNLKS
jgi:putative transposase